MRHKPIAAGAKSYVANRAFLGRTEYDQRAIHFVLLTTPRCGAGLWVSDQAAVMHWFSVGCLLEQAIEEQPTGSRPSSIEPEGELVEGGVEVLRTNCFLVSAEDPACEERGGAVHPGISSCASWPLRFRLETACA